MIAEARSNKKMTSLSTITTAPTVTGLSAKHDLQSDKKLPFGQLCVLFEKMVKAKSKLIFFQNLL